KLEGTRIINTLNELKTYEDEDFRIRVIRQVELLEEAESTGKTAKWGKYLRAPEIYFEIMEEHRDKFLKLEEVANLEYGIKTGINEFFYLNEEKIKHWGIEKEFVMPIVKSLKDFDTIQIVPKNHKMRVFRCNKSKKELLKEKKLGALKYIEWGEKQKTKERGRYKKGGITFPEVPSVQGRKYWYDLGEREEAEFLINQFVRERIFFPVHKGSLADHTMFEGKAKEKKESKVIPALLNSSITFFLMEISGRFSMGDGLLTLYGPDIKNLWVIDPKQVHPEIHKKILDAFNSLLTRPIKPIFEEVKEKDRQRLDRLVLKAIGLDPKKYLKPIYDGLCELVRERIELARMRKKVQQARTERDVEKIKEQLLSNILPEGPKKFPEEFLPSLKKEDFQEISIPASPLKLGRYFFGRQEVISEDGFNYQARSVEEAKFIIYSQRPDSFIVRVPKNDIAISKAVMEYEKYLRELKDEFFAAFFQRIHDHKQADALTQVIFQEQGLPEVAGS
ncbi:MAG TPA: hypothetical protein ACFYEM_08275, partial [Candidatus Hypogeohydataceae bacterium YC40]